MSITELLSNIGGIIKIMQVVFYYLALPVNHFLFMFAMIQKMYFGRSVDEHLFTRYETHSHGNAHHHDHGSNNKDKEKHTHTHSKVSEYLNLKNIPQKLKDTKFMEDIKLNRHIKITNREKLLLMFHYYCP